MLDAHGALVYVGKAKCLRSRLLCYFRPKSRDPKAGRILEHTTSIVWEIAAHEFAALLRELELIQRWQPRFNVQGQPYRRRRTFVCLGRKPAPYLFLGRKPADDVLACYGPAPSGRTASEAVRRLNDGFRLRDCAQSVPMLFADQKELFPLVRTAACLRHELATCLGPCAAACTRTDYAERVRAARSFLTGADTTLLQSLERDMKRAAEAEAFERALVLRDKLLAVRWLHEQLERLRLAQERHTFVYAPAVPQGRAVWYLIERARVRAALFAPRSHADWRTAAERIAATLLAERPKGPPTLEEVDGILLTAGWFRRHPDERKHTLSPRAAVALCRKRLHDAEESINCQPIQKTAM
jgi:excinuclease ABC subunit C